MRTVYIDVYFLINFTADTLAIYFAAVFSRVKITKLRLLVSSLLGALFAVVILLMPERVIPKLVCAVLGLLTIGAVGPRGACVTRRVRFLSAFLIFSALLGGAVSFLFDILGTYLGDRLEEGREVNRPLLLIALGVLFCIGAFKMIVAIFSGNTSSQSRELEIEISGKSIRAEAFVDSGNLAIDPMDMSPVMLIKKRLASELLPNEVTDLSDPDKLTRDMRKRIRLIPVSMGGKTRVLTGVRVDKVRVISDSGCAEIVATLAIDKEGGDFGGYELLVPSAALCDVEI
ncbi:MAG: sigma-E processing peptidase SpoIIGA [Clostridia bacterium]|nr:sigma-E processing peptidase SpoIIGA [Clostridia bacterium]